MHQAISYSQLLALAYMFNANTTAVLWKYNPGLKSLIAKNRPIQGNLASVAILGDAEQSALGMPSAQPTS